MASLSMIREFDTEKICFQFYLKQLKGDSDKTDTCKVRQKVRKYSIYRS